MAKDRATEAAIEISESSKDLLAARLETKLSPRMARQATRTYLQDEVEPILDAADPFHITHNVLRRIERKGLSVRRGLSFRANMMEMSEARKLDTLRPSWALDEKTKAYALLDALHIRRPESDSRTYRFSEISPNFPKVIKATRATGARGCYLAYNPQRIVHVRDNQEFSSWNELSAHARALMEPNTGNRLPDSWMVEELVLESSSESTAARDLKFYSFYGETVFVRESVRGANPKVRFYGPDNGPIDTGREEDLEFTPIGVTSQQLELVSRISTEIPHPFMRIDMLNGEDGLVFGEFTPRPGNFDQFSPEWDRRMGEEWARAESRILRDLLQGKSFEPYLMSTGLLKK